MQIGGQVCAITHIVLTAARSKPIREPKKVFLIDRIQNSDNCLLYDLVLQRSNTQRALPTISFGNIDPPRWRCPEGSFVKSSVQLGHALEKTFLIVSPRHAVHAHRSIAAQGKALCSMVSQVLQTYPTSHQRGQQGYGFWPFLLRPVLAYRAPMRSTSFCAKDFPTCTGSPTARDQSMTGV
ncbi:hypothetical protein PspR76_14965 [Pseudomonas sp. R76]|nr:hypothetical protein PspR76_14965 [Pseudomonas sp. R76]